MITTARMIGMALVLATGAETVLLAQTRPPAEAAATGRKSDEDRDAMAMFRRGSALLADRQDDRAVSVFEGMLLNFPRSPVRHQAALALGAHFSGKGDHETAIKHLATVLAAGDADDDQQAEALYRTGAAHYEQNDTARALAFLRRTTENFPWNTHSNDAYYYIGLCHFREKRWTRAVEAFRMVGTSIAPAGDALNLAESGQRYMIRVTDKDLRVLGLDGRKVDVLIATASGDRETVALEAFDREGETWLGSIKTLSGTAVPGDGLLQFKGSDNIRVAYLDRNTLDGAGNVKRQAASRLVSTAAGGFTDGAFREYVQGVFSSQRTFLQVRDFDADKTDGNDPVSVRLYSQRRLTDQELGDRGIEARPEDGPQYELHDQKTVTLTETGPHTGVFTAVVNIMHVVDKAGISSGAPNLQAVEGDHIFLDYLDEFHIEAVDAPRTLTVSAEFLTGEIPDVWVAQREVRDANLRSRKSNIEAAFYLRLGEVFKSVGLVDRVAERTLIGLEKVNEVINQALRINIDRELIEEAYRLKWELQVLSDNLRGAIATCRTFMSIFPGSPLADRALMQIAKASKETGDTRQAFSLFEGILQLNTTPDVKGEAQYNIALLLEAEAGSRASAGLPAADRPMGASIAAFQRVAEQYPDSPFAGESLGKVIDFYIASRDYGRCNELLERTFVDYPDAAFLDGMLLKWGVVLARMNQPAEARAKLQQLLQDYPSSPFAAQAKPLIDRLAKQ